MQVTKLQCFTALMYSKFIDNDKVAAFYDGVKSEYAIHDVDEAKEA